MPLGLRTRETDQLLRGSGEGAEAVVTQHWRLEVANVFLGAERAKKKSSAESAQFLTLLENLAIETDSETDRSAFGATMSLARTYRLTSYDAAYLEVATRRGLPLATLDADLRRAASKEGVRLVP